MENHLWVSSNGYGFSLDAFGNGQAVFSYFQHNEAEKGVRVLKQMVVPDALLKELVPAIIALKNSVAEITGSVTTFCAEQAECSEVKPATLPPGVVYH